MQKQNQQDLSGLWKIRLDPKKKGILQNYQKERWQQKQESDQGTLILPGILQAQGYGDPIGLDTPWVSSLHDSMWYLREEYQGAQENEVNVPFLSQPPRHYLGWAWYQREIELSEEGQYQLYLECTHWKTTVWVDGEEKGSVLSLCSPHSYLLGNIKKGSHFLTILVDNSMQYPYRPDGHAVSDALGATWNGIAGEISIKRLPDAAILENRIWWDITIKKAIIEIVLQNLTSEKKTAEITITTPNNEIENQNYKITNPNNKKKSCLLLPKERKICQIEYLYTKEEPLWDEYQPNLNKITIQCQCGETIQTIEESFGFRKMEAKEDGFFINGRPIYLRGTHFGGEFPLTGYPATTKEEWKRIFQICKKWGMNFMRFHSYCPPKAAFSAADEIGFYLQIECGMWNYFSDQETKENKTESKEEKETNFTMQQILYQETERILAAFGNHPSFLLFSPSNEPAGDWWNPLKKWLTDFRSRDNRRLYTIQSGWPYPMKPKEIEEPDYLYFHRSGFGPYPGGSIRNQSGWFGKDYAPSLEGVRCPVICHEMGQWCSYPDFSIIEKFTGYMQPSNYKVFRAQAEKKGVLSQNKEFVFASGHLQTALYKEDLEANFRTPHLYGFELLDLHDYLGQGGAWIGVLDAFWEEKGYIKPEEFREFCNETVLLLRIPKYIFTTEETLEGKAEIAHFGKAAKKEAIVRWRLKKGETLLREEPLCQKEIPLGKNIPLGTIQISLAELAAPAQYRIELILEEKEEILQNHWDFWVYQPTSFFLKQKEKFPNGIISVEENDFILTDVREAKKALQQGKAVFLSPSFTDFSYKCPPLNSKSVFWNSQMGPRWDRGLGILCKKDHPAFSEFPTESYQQWQWAGILEGARGINLERIRSDLVPLVQVIDDWNRSYKMALLLEAKVGKGRLLLSGCNLEQGWEKAPQRAQLRQSLLQYFRSEAFHPKIRLKEEEAFSWYQDTLLLWKLKAVCWIEELPKVDCRNCISVNMENGLELEEVTFPLHIRIRWERPIWVHGFVYFPIQNRRDHRGDIREYEIWVKEIGEKEEKWELKKSGEFATSFEPKEVFFYKSKTNEIRFIIKNGFACEHVQKWEVGESGWKRSCGAFADSSVGIGKISIYSEEWIEGGGEGEQIKTSGIATATLEIEE